MSMNETGQWCKSYNGEWCEHSSKNFPILDVTYNDKTDHNAVFGICRSRLVCNSGSGFEFIYEEEEG